MNGKPESHESVWVLAIAPSIWIVHFMACYLTAAIWCAKFSHASDRPDVVRWAMLIYTAIALLAIAATGLVGLRRYRSRSRSRGPHDQDTHEDRHSFMGFAVLLLSGLSAIATVFVGLVAVWVGKC